MRDPGCCDMFPGGYTQSNWEAMRGKPQKMLQILKYNQTGFLATQMLHLAFFLIWCLATRVPGFNLYDGSVAANANTHSGWWLMADALVLAMGMLAPYYSLHYIREGQTETVETGVKPTANWLMAYSIIAVLGAIMTLVHAILSLLELTGGCDSYTFCRDYRYMHIAMIVLLFLLTALLLWSAALAYTFRINIEGAIVWGDLRPTVWKTNITASEGNAAGPMEIVTDGGGTDMKSSITTPLLQMRMQQQQQQQISGKFRHVAGGRTLVGMK